MSASLTKAFHRPSAVALALHLGFGVALASFAVIANPAWAESGESDTRGYRIAAGGLGPALARYAVEAGVALSFDPAIVENKTTAGLDGDYTVEAGFSVLLDGSGLQAVREGTGYALRPLPAQGTTLLPPVRIEAQESSGSDAAVTERSGSYSVAVTRTATRLDLSPRETPQSVSVVTRQQIEDQNLTNVAEVLGRSVGITLAQNETDRANTSSRGFYYPSIQFDGMPTQAAGMQDLSVLSDTALYDRVEIVRGATGLLTGVGDPGAAINLIRKRPTRAFQGEVSGSAGRCDAYRLEADVSGPVAADGRIRGRLVGAWRDTDSHLAEYNNQRGLLYGVLEADITDATLLMAGIDYLSSDSRGMTYGAPVPLFYADGSATRLPRSTTTGADWTLLNNDRSTTFARLEHRFAGEWAFKAQYQRLDSQGENAMAFLYGFPDRDTGEGVSVFLNSYELDQQQDSVDLYLTGPFNLFGRRHEAVFGWSWNDLSSEQNYHPVLSSTPLESFYEWPRHPAPVFSGEYGRRYATQERQDGAYIATRLQLADPLRVILGTRLSNVRYSNVEAPAQGQPSSTVVRYDDELTPYAGLVYDISRRYSAYASYTQIFRWQTSKDVSGALLDPLTGTNYEAGIKADFNDGRFFVSAAVFKIEQNNLAEFDAEIDGEARYRAVDGVTIRGYELEVSGQPLPRWNLSGGFTRMLAQDGNGNRLVLEAPDNLLRLTSSYQLSGALDGLSLGGHTSWQSDVISPEVGPNGEDAVQRAYALLDLFCGYRFNDQLRVQANLNNVFDKVYYKSVLSYGYYGEPRNLTVSLKYSF